MLIDKEWDNTSFEIWWWCYRRMCKIPWTRKIGNEEVLKSMGTDRMLMAIVKKTEDIFFWTFYERIKVKSTSRLSIRCVMMVQ